MLAAAVDDLESFLLGFRRARILAQEMTESKNGVKWRPEFVGDLGQELTLGVAGDLCGAARFLQLCVKNCLSDGDSNLAGDLLQEKQIFRTPLPIGVMVLQEDDSVWDAEV